MPTVNNWPSIFYAVLVWAPREETAQTTGWPLGRFYRSSVLDETAEPRSLLAVMHWRARPGVTLPRKKGRHPG
jgi:hypothetical protein